MFGLIEPDAEGEGLSEKPDLTEPNNWIHNGAILWNMIHPIQAQSEESMITISLWFHTQPQRC